MCIISCIGQILQKKNRLRKKGLFTIRVKKKVRESRILGSQGSEERTPQFRLVRESQKEIIKDVVIISFLKICD